MSDLTIEGNGFTISGGNTYRIFTIVEGKVEINELTVIEGKGEFEGAISNHAELDDKEQ